MKKLTRKSLNELAKTMPVIEESLQMSYVGEEMEHHTYMGSSVKFSVYNANNGELITSKTINMFGFWQ